MTRTISLVAVVGAALVLTAQAVGKGQPVEPQWQQALETRSAALNEQHGLGTVTGVRTGPHGGWHRRAAPDRPVRRGAELRAGLTLYVPSGTNVLDARERSFAAKHEAQLATGAFEQALQLRGQALNESYGIGGDGFVAGDDHFVSKPAEQPTVTRVSTPSGTEIEWPGIGIGVFVGLLLLGGIAIALRRTRVRPLAH